MLKRLQTRIPGSIDKIRFDYFLMEWLPRALGIYLTKTRIRKLILSGAVFINRRKQKNPTITLYTGAVVEVYYDEEKLNKNMPQRMDESRLETNRIAYEDEWIMVIDKPPGLPTQPTMDPLRANLYGLVGRFLSARDRIENAYVGLHHRLDRDTSGLVLFTKKTEANRPVSELFKQHQIQKSYQCLVWKSPSASGYIAEDWFVVENFLGKLEKKDSKITKFGSVRSGGDFAKTEFRVIESFRDVFWLEARPMTGRTHQIRVHASEQGLPILGDPLYFPEDVHHMSAAPRLMLHAAQLQFPHPMTQKMITVQSPLPDDFMQMLSGLRA